MARSASTLLALYIVSPSGSGWQARSTDSSLNVSADMVNLFFGLGKVAAKDDDVYTKRFIAGSLDAVLRALRAPWTALGTAIAGSLEPFMSCATWKNPAAPVSSRHTVSNVQIPHAFWSYLAFITSNSLVKNTRGFHIGDLNKFEATSTILLREIILHPSGLGHTACGATYFIARWKSLVCNVWTYETADSSDDHPTTVRCGWVLNSLNGYSRRGNRWRWNDRMRV